MTRFATAWQKQTSRWGCFAGQRSIFWRLVAPRFRSAMATTMNFDDPVATALRVARLLERADLAYGLYGGLAVAAWGVPRETKDADMAVVSADAARLVEILQQDGIRAVAAFDRVRFGGLVVSRATLLGGPEDTGLNTVDLVEPESPRYAAVAVARALRAPLRGSEISLLTPEDVVIFKVLSTRDKDLEDAAAIIQELGPQLDLATVRAELEELAAEIRDHDIDARWRRCLPG
ncbi:MAG TPA: hypothetical protein VMS98_06230 [Thermoanaerobaculia bacterium]|nr:hypothetical protein [Thermoanaerobaculia bacterium]